MGIVTHPIRTNRATAPIASKIEPGTNNFTASEWSSFRWLFPITTKAIPPPPHTAKTVIIPQQ